MRRTLLMLGLFCALAPAAQAAWHFELGIGEQQPRIFDDPRFAALGLEHVRLVTSYDVACRRAPTWPTWTPGSPAPGAWAPAR